MKTPHLIAALAAVILLACGLTAGSLHTRRLEDRYVHRLAGQRFNQRLQGTALQAVAFRQPDLLPIYGSSELEQVSPYHPSTLFREYPTGFTVFPIGKTATTSLIFLQKLAAVGADARGKRVVIFLTPAFFHLQEIGDSYYAGNFSRLHANELIFGTDLSMGIRREAATRMLDYPETLAPDTLLDFGVRRLAGARDSWLDEILYWGALPLGKLQLVALRLQDQWATRKFLQEQPNLEAEVHRQPAQLDWPALEADADRASRQVATNNPFGFRNDRWERELAPLAEGERHSRNDADVVDALKHSKEWTDLNLLLRGLRELGARPLLLSMPIHEGYQDFVGTTAQARNAYYEKLRRRTKEFGFTLIDFADHGSDKYFAIDPSSHLSDKGWAYYDQALDAFYHRAER